MNSQLNLLMVIIVVLMGISIAQRACAATTHVLLGDSLSKLRPTFVVWPEMVFGDDVTNWSAGGYGADTYLSGQGWWLPHAEPGQVWWLALGAGDIYRGDSASETLETERQLIELILATDAAEVNLIHEPLPYDVPGEPSRQWRRDGLAELAELELALCAEISGLHCAASWIEPHTLRPHYGEDGVHFNQFGHDRAAELVPEPGTSLLLLTGLVWLSKVGR